MRRCVAFIAFLEDLDAALPASMSTIHLVPDNVRMHTGQLVHAWLVAHPRFVCHFTPVHCSWMNQVEQWFPILQRRRLRFADFADLATLEERLLAFAREGNAHAHPFTWSKKSVAKAMAQRDTPKTRAA